MTDTEELKNIVNHQSNLQSLWLLHPTVSEALLVAALRHLHAVIEGDDAAAEYSKRFYWEVEE